MTDLIMFQLASLILLGLGMFGLIYRQTLVGILISVELLLNGAGLSIIVNTQLTNADSVLGQLATLLVMGLAAAETTIILAIIIVVSKRVNSIEGDQLNLLKG